MVTIVQQAVAQLPCSFELCCLKVAHVDLDAGTGLGSGLSPEFSGASARHFFFRFGMQVVSDLSHFARAKAINRSGANATPLKLVRVRGHVRGRLSQVAKTGSCWSSNSSDRFNSVTAMVPPLESRNSTS